MMLETVATRRMLVKFNGGPWDGGHWWQDVPESQLEGGIGTRVEIVARKNPGEPRYCYRSVDGWDGSEVLSVRYAGKAAP